MEIKDMITKAEELSKAAEIAESERVQAWKIYKETEERIENARHELRNTSCDEAFENYISIDREYKRDRAVVDYLDALIKSLDHWAGYAYSFAVLDSLAKNSKLDGVPIRYKKFKDAVALLGNDYFDVLTYGDHISVYRKNVADVCIKQYEISRFSFSDSGYFEDCKFSSNKAKESANTDVHIPTKKEIEESVKSIKYVKEAYEKKEKELESWARNLDELMKYAACEYSNIKKFRRC